MRTPVAEHSMKTKSWDNNRGIMNGRCAQRSRGGLSDISIVSHPSTLNSTDVLYYYQKKTSWQHSSSQHSATKRS